MHPFVPSTVRISLMVCRCRSESGTSFSSSYRQLTFPNVRIARGVVKQYPASLNMLFRSYQSSWQVADDDARAGARSPSFARDCSFFRINTARSCFGINSDFFISNRVGPIHFISWPQKLTRLSGAPLSTTRRKRPIGLDQLPAVLRTYSIRCWPNSELNSASVRRKELSMQYLS